MAAKLSGPSGRGSKTISQNSDINVTPFVDIMLVLLIIFMVAAPLATVSIRLDLPPATPPTGEKAPDPVYITIQESGSIFIAEKQSSIENLYADVCAAVGNPTGKGCTEERVFVRAQPEVKYNQFMEVMNDLQSHGFLKVGLLNEDIT